MKKLLALLCALLAAPAAAQVIPSGPVGSLNYWGVGGLSQVLNPGLAGQCLTTQGVGSAPVWVNCQVSSLSLLPPINTNQFYGNTSGVFGPPVGVDVNTILNTVGYDIARPPPVESIIYKSNVGPLFNWQALFPGTPGSLLTSGGPTNPPFWATSPIQGNLAAICQTVGAILYFDTPSSLWKCLAPGTLGQVLQTGGAAANPSWLTLSATAPLTYSSGGFSIATNGISNSLLATMPANAVKCNSTGSTGNAQDCPKPWVSVTDPSIGATCNGSTDDSSAFTAAIAAGNNILVPAGLTCIVHDIAIAANQTIDCSGSALQAPTVAGANQWVIKKTGFNSRVRNCQINDTSNATKHATTLNGAVSPGATTIVVTSATGMQVNQAIAIALDSGAYWLTKITNIAGTTITLADAIPSTQAVAPTVTAGGSNYAVNDHLIVQGGSGPPITAHVTTVSAGAITAVAVDAPGLYSTFPTSPAAVQDANTQTASGATLTLTSAGASSGNIVESAWGTLVVDNSTEGFVENVTFGSVPAGLQILDSNGTGTGEETVRAVSVNAFQLFALLKDVDVHDSRFVDIIGFGTTHNASSFGVAGVYINGDTPGTTPTGGNLFRGVTMLSAENAWLDNAGQLDTFTQTIGDTTRNYNFVCNGCAQNAWGGGTNMLFSGPNARSGTGNAGGGMYFGNSAINNVLEGLRANNNAFDLYVADAGSAIWLAGQAWGPSRVASGLNTASIRAPAIFATASPTGVGGAGTTIYLGPGGENTNSAVVAMLVPANGVATSFACASGTAPGAGQSYTCNFVDNTNVLGSCSYSGAAAFGCNYNGPGMAYISQHQIALQIVSSAGAATASFRGYVAGY